MLCLFLDDDRSSVHQPSNMRTSGTTSSECMCEHERPYATGIGSIVLHGSKLYPTCIRTSPEIPSTPPRWPLLENRWDANGYCRTLSGDTVRSALFSLLISRPQSLTPLLVDRVSSRLVRSLALVVNLYLGLLVPGARSASFAYGTDNGRMAQEDYYPQ